MYVCISSCPHQTPRTLRMSKEQQQVLANDFSATASSEVKKFEANPVAIILIFILFTSLTVNAQKIRRV